jgi:hypothetical protein
MIRKNKSINKSIQRTPGRWIYNCTAPGIEDEIKALMDDYVPVILFDRYLPTLPTSAVIIDKFQCRQQHCYCPVFRKLKA